MKTQITNAHDYITVSIISTDGVRVNLTSSRFGARFSASAKPAADFGPVKEQSALARTRRGSLHAFLNAKPGADKKCGATFGDMMTNVKKVGTEAANFPEFFSKLDALFAA